MMFEFDVNDVRYEIDDAGRILAWSHDVWSFSHAGRPMPGTDGLDLLAAWHRAEPVPPSTPPPLLAPEVGIHRNAWPIYKG